MLRDFSGQKIRGKFRSIFRENIHGSKTSFVPKFDLQTCHLKRSAEALTWKSAAKSASRKAPGQNGVPRKVLRKCSGSCASVEVAFEGTFRSTIFGTFPGEGFGTFTLKTFSALIKEIHDFLLN